MATPSETKGVPQVRNWPHAPAHRLGATGAYMVTAGTYQKVHHFRDPDRLSFLHDELLATALRYGWQLQAWAMFSNHYHFIALAPDNPDSLSPFLRQLHTVTAGEVNRSDGVEGRRVWFQYWDTHLTFERSYLARLHYVHQNPVRHGLVPIAAAYPWCSAGWFEQRASPSFVKVVTSFKTDRIQLPDEYDVALAGWPPPGELLAP
jgi:putative transposase